MNFQICFKRIQSAAAITMLSLSLGSCTGSKQVHVIRAVDGDTLEVRLPTNKIARVRLIGIDTPETVDPRKPVQCYGPEASKRMHKLADGKIVLLIAKPDEDTDKYGRLLRYVVLDTEDLGAEMIRDGYARSYDVFPHPREETYDQLEIQARTAKRGLWSACATAK